MTDTPKDPELCARIADLKNENAALRSSLAEAKGEREKELREAFEAGADWEYCTKQRMSGDEAFAAFLKREGK